MPGNRDRRPEPEQAAGYALARFVEWQNRPVLLLRPSQKTEIEERPYAFALALNPQTPGREIQGHRLVGSGAGFVPVVIFQEQPEPAAAQHAALNARHDVVSGILKKLGYAASAEEPADLGVLPKGERSKRQQREKESQHIDQAQASWFPKFRSDTAHPMIPARVRTFTHQVVFGTFPE